VIQMMTVRDVMTASVITVHPGTPLKEVARLLLDRGISGVPVVDADGVVLGVVSEADFLIKEQGIEHLRHRRLGSLIGESPAGRAQLAKLQAVTAGEAMTSPAVTIEPTRAISDAAALMTTRGMNRLPVVEHGHLIGIVTRADLVRAYVSSDDELARTIREDVLLRILWLDPASFSVVVHDGVASIIGGVERRTTAEMVGRAVAMVPGVVDVRANVTWAVDDSLVGTPAIPAMPFNPR
jgi:CBS domain-containing protein